MTEKPNVRWCVTASKRSIYGKTKAECLRRAKSFIEQRRQEGLGYTLQQEFDYPRTSPFPQVLVVCRYFDTLIHSFNSSRLENNLRGRLVWVDSCGQRSVYWYTESMKKQSDLDYELDSLDLPWKVFQELKDHFRSNYPAFELHPHFLMMRREDPGLGINLPEIDDPILQKLQQLEA